MISKILTLIVLLANFSVFAASDCKELSIQAATLLSQGINQENLSFKGFTVVKSSQNDYAIQVIFDSKDEPGSYIKYNVVAEKSYLSTNDTLLCNRVTLVEFAGEH